MRRDHCETQNFCLSHQPAQFVRVIAAERASLFVYNVDFYGCCAELFACRDHNTKAPSAVARGFVDVNTGARDRSHDDCSPLVGARTEYTAEADYEPQNADSADSTHRTNTRGTQSAHSHQRCWRTKNWSSVAQRWRGEPMRVSRAADCAGRFAGGGGAELLLLSVGVLW